MTSNEALDRRVAVVGASGFVGSAVVRELALAGCEVIRVRAPRMSDGRTESREMAAFELAPKLRGVGAVINCAGLADASSGDESSLLSANAWSAAAVARAVSLCQIPRLIHVSSAAVQGRKKVLDASPADGAVTPYGRSKAAGERLVQECFPQAVLYRPPGVHDSDRGVTRAVIRVASSSVSSVAGEGDFPSAQALLPNVASAIVFLAMAQANPPNVVSHPREDLTTGSLLRLLGDREPHKVPIPVARAAVGLGIAMGRILPFVGAQARRLESLWFGQAQAISWLEGQGWRSPLGVSGWVELGDIVRERKV